tara:strand:- start:5505 stop:6314 length:810 start_codon:yes stop_codon:yes gene_type:complete
VSKNNQYDTIKVTVITVVYNDEANIQSTIESVINQGYPHLEYIIVDGRSSDGTLEIIKKYENNIQILISEKDEGIYDAMHKGIKLSSGQYINFMHSGDSFYSKQTLSNVMKNLDTDSDIIYGNYYVKYPIGFGRTELSHEPKNLWKPFFNQQCVFYKSLILNNKPFNTKYNIAADFFFTMESISRGYRINKIDEIICYSLKGGYSNQQEFKAIKQYYNIIKEFNLKGKKMYFYKKIFWIFFIEKVVKRSLPINLYYFLQNYFRKIMPMN